jgi:hypothetical protein
MNLVYIFFYLFCNVFIIYLVIFLYRWHNITTFHIVYHRSGLNICILYILCAIFVFVDNCIVASCFLHCCDGSHIHGGVTSWRNYGEQTNEWIWQQDLWLWTAVIKLELVWFYCSHSEFPADCRPTCLKAELCPPVPRAPWLWLWLWLWLCLSI